MRFKVDENLPRELSQLLRDAGWDCLSVVEQALGGKDDAHITATCDAENRILITLDLGFSNIKAYLPRAHPGFIVFRLKHQDKPNVLQISSRLVEALRQRELRNELWIVEEDRIRVRTER